MTALLLIAVLSISTLNFASKPPSYVAQARSRIGQFDSASYTPLGPINIQNNSAFSSYGFLGNGSIGNPYIIEGFNITSDITPIIVNNTDVHFRIQNCWLLRMGTSGSAVQFVNMMSGTIDRCVAYAVSNDSSTIEIQDCNSSELSGNEISGDFGGIDVSMSYDVLLVNNTIEFAMYGISVSFSHHVTLEANRLFDNSWGVYIQDSHDCNIVNNKAVGNNNVGIELFGSVSCSVYGNNVTANSGAGSGGVESGIYLFNTNDSTIEANHVIDGNGYGVNIGLHSTGNQIFLNNITWNSWGNGFDNGSSNTWDDGVEIGNRWSDYNGTGAYPIEGMAGSVDRFPMKYDWTPPQISFVDPPIAVPINQPTQITALVDDRSGILQVILSYRISIGPWYNITMASLVDGYVATIPGQPDPTNVEFIVMAQDVAGNWGSRGGDFIIIAESDTTSPDIVSWRYPWFPMPGQEARVTANVTDSSGVQIVILEYFVNGLNPTNVTMALIGNGLYEANIPGQPNQTLVEYRIYASDTAGNWGVTGTDSYMVTDEDRNGPDILDVYFWPEEPTKDQSVLVNATIEDYSGVAEALILWFLENSTWGEIQLVQDGLFWTGSIPAMPAGTAVSFGIHARDTLDNWNVAGNYTYVVLSESEGPAIDVNYWPTAPTEYESVTVAATISDPDGVANVEIIFLLDKEYGGTIQPNYEAGVWSGEIPAQPAGTTVLFWVYAADDLGHGNSAGNFTYTVIAGDDQEGPEISVAFTPENPNQRQPVLVSAIIEDASGVAEAYILYFLDGGSFGQMSMILSGVIWIGSIPTFPVGTNVTFGVHASDTLGNWNFAGNFTYIVQFESETTTTTPWGNSTGIVYQIVNFIVTNISLVGGGVIIVIVIVVIMRARRAQQYASWGSQF
jgi:parallel beta-helix repeat protein